MIKFNVLTRVGANDYRITSHEREEDDLPRQPAEEVHHEGHLSGGTPTGDGSASAASLAVVEDDNVGSGCHGRGCKDLPRLGG
ncbi:hypothetical protein PoB_004212900 [Plakobranchus ocellatus]|uniref:Uncharacterized protein n=1 Tax=Plakobranchus ocellatus TaxID=259542 RepID=A0AAV4BA89_9GAST|nr:hypothetical protein PoB_004212900 [Plakobranchus ocellatus]